MDIDQNGRFNLPADRFIILPAIGGLMVVNAKPSMSLISDLIGAGGLDTVNLRSRGRPLRVMVVDDLGHPKGLPINDAATALYHEQCVPGANPPPIRGDVAIVFDDDFA